MKIENVAIYGVVAFAIAVMMFSVYSVISPKPQTQQYVQNSPADACGDLNDISNVQHLSHHPEQYKDCINKVDPSVFKQAVGEDLNTFMSRNNIG